MKYRVEARGGGLTVEDGLIAVSAGDVAHHFSMPDCELRPGLINAHEHLGFNHFPRLGEPPYQNAYEWGLDLHARFGDEVARAKSMDRKTALLFGALKNLLGGVTTVVHHDSWEADFDDGFPIRVVPVRNAHSLRFEPDLAAAFAEAGAQLEPICIHLAEGIDGESAAEPLVLAEAGQLSDRVIAVHNVGVDGLGVRALSESGAAVVWCPTANEFLFGRTAPRELFDAGIDVMLGTDSLLTGTGTMLDELRAARAFGFMNDQRLLDAVGTVAARRFRLPEPALSRGSPADFVALAAPVLEADARDVWLVVVAGRPCLAHPMLAGLFEICGVDYERLNVKGEARLVAAPLAGVAATVSALSPECARILN